MIDSTRQWFLALSRREQILIGVLAALVAAVILFYAIIQPLIEAVRDAREDYRETVEQAALVVAKVEMLKAPVIQPAIVIDGSLPDYIGSSGEAKGFTIEALQAKGDGRVGLTIPSAKPGALFGWLSELEQSGLFAEELQVEPNDNGTVRATITLRRAG